MARPRNSTPAYDAIVNALTKHTGQPNCLQPAYLFKLGIPKDVNNAGAPRPGTVYGEARCFVMPIDDREKQPQLRMSNIAFVELTVEIRCFYYAPESDIEAWREQMARIAADKRRVFDALTEPGVLRYDPTGNETGLTGYSLRPDQWDPRGPVPLPSAPRVYQLTHVFKADADFERTST